jgi:hypothetical protein
MELEPYETDRGHFFHFVGIFLEFGHGFIKDNFGGGLDNRRLIGFGEQLKIFINNPYPGDQNTIIKINNIIGIVQVIDNRIELQPILLHPVTNHSLKKPDSGCLLRLNI